MEDTKSETIMSEIMKEHLAKFDKYIEDLLQQAKGGKKEGWDFVTQKKGVAISRQKPKEGGLNCMKGEGDIEATLEDFWIAIQEVENIKEWDAMFLGHTIYETSISEKKGAYIANLRFKASPLVASRDFCVFGGHQWREDGIFAFTTSIDYPGCPANPPFIRGELKSSGHWVRKVGETLKDTYVVQLDPKGGIPTWIANLVITDQPLNIAAMRDYFSRKASKK